MPANSGPTAGTKAVLFRGWGPPLQREEAAGSQKQSAEQGQGRMGKKGMVLKGVLLKFLGPENLLSALNTFLLARGLRRKL